MEGADLEPNILERLLDEQEKEPCRLEITLLRTITKNFSDDRIIGNGGCGVVYKGILRNGTVAVKKIFSDHTIDENMFNREVNSMMMVKHENIVRFLGYCSDTQGEASTTGGNFVMAEVRERLLCFEYIKNGSLQNHIKDELRGLKWHERYQIIRGIFEGLHHLHKDKRIRHMDLKPDNILIGDNLVPKITDFGLSRLDEKSKTMSQQRLLTLGYCAPEYQFHGKMSAKSDIYSLGVIILELVTGSKKDPDIAKVLRRWKHRWNKSSGEAPLLWYRQVVKCLDLSQWCQRENPIDRPNIWDIISELDEIDSWDGQIRYANVATFDKIMSCLEDMLGIEPLEMHFPFALNEPASCSIEVNNDTDNYFVFRIESASLLMFSTQPDKGIVPPRSNLSATVTLQAQDKILPWNHFSEEFIIVQSTRIDAIPTPIDVTEDMINDVVGRVVDEVNLTVVFDMPPTPEEPKIDMHSMKYQEADNASYESYSRPVSGSLEPSYQVDEGPWESMALTVLDDPRYKDGHVLERILDGSESPRKLKYSLLEFITDNFSNRKKIGETGTIGIRGKFKNADVYKGTLRNGEIVTVKKLRNQLEDVDMSFSQELEVMMMVQHQNILRFLGYCSDTEEQPIEQNGQIIMAEEHKRLLCFEYASNGSLEDLLAADRSSGLEWHTLYQIIKGICAALLYLHKEKRIFHLNLTPYNVLLDDQMVPKVADFCLSEFEDRPRSGPRGGSLGYNSFSGRESDIHNLGVLIPQIVTGKWSCTAQDALRKWNHRWKKSGNYRPLWAQQVIKCLELAERCKTERPFIWDVIRELGESDQVSTPDFQTED